MGAVRVPEGCSGVKRNGLVFGVMVIGIALLLWAGWHNLRERRKAMQEAQDEPRGAGARGRPMMRRTRIRSLPRPRLCGCMASLPLHLR